MKNQLLKSVNIALALAVFAVYGCEKDKDDDNTNQAPVALFVATPTSASVGEEIAFTDQSADADGQIVNRLWDFGDGTTSSDPNPTHVYSESGDYPVRLTVTDDKGATAQFEVTIAIDAFAELWAVQLSSSSISPCAPALADDGTIYVGSQDGVLYALYPDGGQKWTFTTGDRIRTTPTIDEDGTVYVGSYDDKVYAINPDGSQKWAFTTGGDIFDASATIDSEGTIYVGSDDDKLYALNPDGSQKWTFTTGGNVRVSPAIAPDGSIVFGSGDAKIYALNPDGSEKWTFNATAVVNSSAAIDSDGVVYVGDDAGKFYAINPNGSLLWQFSPADNNPFLGAPVIGTDGAIYVTTKRGPTTNTAHVYALNPNGTERWNFETAPGSDVAPKVQSDILGTPSIGADGTIYFTYNDGHLYALRSDGSEKFKYKVNTDDPENMWDQAMWTSPAISDQGELFFVDYSGFVYALKVSNSGLANSDWPTRGKNNKRNGR